MTDRIILEDKLKNATSKLHTFFKKFRINVPKCNIEIDKKLDKYTLATHRYPNRIVVRNAQISESVICHELIHRIQRTLESPCMFKYLYTSLAEGMAEFITKALYSSHRVKYPLEEKLFRTLFSVNRNVIRETMHLNNFKMSSQEFESMLKDKNLHPYFRKMISDRKEVIKKTIDDANRLRIDDPTFITHGEEIMAWKFLLNPKFDTRREEINKILSKLFR